MDFGKETDKSTKQQRTGNGWTLPQQRDEQEQKKRTIGYLKFKSLRCHPTNRRTRAESQHRELKKKVSVDYARETGIWF